MITYHWHLRTLLPLKVPTSTHLITHGQTWIFVRLVLSVSGDVSSMDYKGRNSTKALLVKV